jgi:hypothetical protein
MTRIRKAKPLLWVLAGVIVGLLALTLLGGQALAQEPPPAPDAIPLAPNMDSTHFALNWNVSASGGGTIESTHFTVSSTIGQPVTGETSSARYNVCTGYWCWWEYIANIFLPLIIR